MRTRWAKLQRIKYNPSKRSCEVLFGRRILFVPGRFRPPQPADYLNRKRPTLERTSATAPDRNKRATECAARAEYERPPIPASRFVANPPLPRTKAATVWTFPKLPIPTHEPASGQKARREFAVAFPRVRHSPGFHPNLAPRSGCKCPCRSKLGCPTKDNGRREGQGSECALCEASAKNPAPLERDRRRVDRSPWRPSKPAESVEFPP